MKITLVSTGVPARIGRLTRCFAGSILPTLRRTSVSLFSQQLGQHFSQDMSCVNVFHLCLALLINEMKLNESGSHAIGLVMQENNPKGLPINTCIFYSYYLLTLAAETTKKRYRWCRMPMRAKCDQHPSNKNEDEAQYLRQWRKSCGWYPTITFYEF